MCQVFKNGNTTPELNGTSSYKIYTVCTGEIEREREREHEFVREQSLLPKELQVLR